jgi:hypothetical protein
MVHDYVPKFDHTVHAIPCRTVCMQHEQQQREPEERVEEPIELDQVMYTNVLYGSTMYDNVRCARVHYDGPLMYGARLKDCVV